MPEGLQWTQTDVDAHPLSTVCHMNIITFHLRHGFGLGSTLGAGNKRWEMGEAPLLPTNKELLIFG